MMQPMPPAPPPAPVGPPLPFFPPQEPAAAQRSSDAASRKLMELSTLAFDAMYKMVSGFRDMPPRQRLAWYQAHEPLDTALRMLETIWAPEALWMARDSAQLYRARGLGAMTPAPQSDVGY